MGALRWLTALIGRLTGRRRPPPDTPAAPARPPRARRRLRRRRPPIVHASRHHSPGGAPNTATLISAARARGKAVAQSGALDQWLFEHHTLPYLEELRHRRDEAIDEARSRAAAARRADRDETQQFAAEAAAARRDQENLEEQASEALSFMRAARFELNRLARLEARQQEERSLAMPLGPDRGVLGIPLWLDEATAPDQPTGTADEPDGATDLPPANIPPAPDSLLEGGAGMPSGGPIDPRWAGPEAPRMTRRWTGGILLSLILIEVPIQYVIFQFFHGYTPIEEVLTWLFTIPVSAVMVLLPHLAGWWYRDRTSTGADGLMRFVPLLLLGPWAFLACMLGYLRARVLLAPPNAGLGTTGFTTNSSTSYLGAGAHTKIPTTASIAHVTPATMSVMFAALILGVGGIGFMLGIAREHPLVGAYRGARAIRQRIADRLCDVAEPVPLADERNHSLEEQAGLSREQWERHIHGIRAAYAAAVHAYLDAVAETAGDPMVTEAVIGMSQRIAEEEGEPSDPVPVG
jgi:hypothetical protein